MPTFSSIIPSIIVASLTGPTPLDLDVRHPREVELHQGVTVSGVGCRISSSRLCVRISKLLARLLVRRAGNATESNGFAPSEADRSAPERRFSGRVHDLVVDWSSSR